VDRRHYFLKRIGYAFLTLIVVASFNFILFRILPGDPARLLLPRGRWEAETIAKQREAFNLDKPLWQQFIYYWGDTVQLQFGDSFKEKRPVTETVGERIGPTILLTGTGMLFAIIVGVTTGVFAGWRRAGPFDLASTGTSMVFYSMPTMWLGLMLIMLFAVKLGWFPVGRMEESGAVYASSWERLTSILDHLVLPALTFGLVYIGQYHLIMRSSVTGVMKEDFVLTGRAKGLSSLRVLRRHIVPNAMLPTFTLIMMNFGFIMSGAILTETVFNWPGLGLLAYEAMIERDYPVMQAVFLVMSVAVIFCNLIADIAYYYLDPRVQA
jgi:peptide/nickel transport system permease protein